MSNDNRHPARIWATVNGARTRLPNGKRFLIGGWAEERHPDRTKSERQYVRADVAEETLAALKEGRRALGVAVKHAGGDPESHGVCRQMDEAISKMEAS